MGFFRGFLSPLGVALSGAGISKAALLSQLQSQYQSFAQSATAATHQLNSATTSALNQVGGQVVRLDTDALFADILANPARYGIQNTTGTACAGSVAQALCTPADQAKADAMLFADGFHPGPKAHQMMADYLLASLQAPADMVGLRAAAMQSGTAAMDFVRQDSNHNRIRRQPVHTLEAIAAYQHDAGGEGGHVVYAGAKAQLSEAWQLGAVFAHQDQDSRMGQTRINSRSNSISTTVRYDKPQWWLGGMVHINDSDYQTNRTIRLGHASLSHNGETGGSSMGAALFGGHEWPLSPQTRIAALADLSMVSGKVHGFSEQGGATKMQFGEQKYTALQSGLGAELNHQLGSWQPYIHVRWVKSWRNNDDAVVAGMNGSQFAVAAPKSDTSWVQGQMGVQWQPQASPWRAFASVGRDFGRSGHSQTAIRLGVGARF